MKKHRVLHYEREEDVIDRLTGTFKEGVFKSPRKAYAVAQRMNERDKNARKESRS